MQSNPKDWRIEQLETVAKQYGVAIRKTGESHVVFDHENWIELLCVPAHRPIKPIYVKKFSNYSPRSPKSHIWRILNENDSEKCSHSPLCCAFSESFSFNLHSNLTFHQDFKIVVNRYKIYCSH